MDDSLPYIHLKTAEIQIVRFHGQDQEMNKLEKARGWLRPWNAGELFS